MTKLLLLLLLSLSAEFTFAQQLPDPYSIEVVKYALAQPAVISTGFMEKQLNRLGDKVSIALLKLYTKDELKKPELILRIAPVIREAFAAPHIITIKQDRSPKITLFMLESINKETDHPEAKKEISILIQYLVKQSQQ